MNKNDLCTSGSSTDIRVYTPYKLEPLPKDTSLETIIELINLLEIHLYCDENRPDICTFVKDHPGLVSKT